MAPVGRSLTVDEIALFDHVPPADAEQARLHRVRWLASGAHGMTFGRHVLLVRGHEANAKLIAHELVHVRQFGEQGVVRFLARYVVDYARNLARLRKHRAAYLAIPAEVEARDETKQWQARHPEVGP
jgi:hypothetical protein